ncbi:hypothetical protein FOMPIDRAFT_1025065, partial [Fomitopsis schrenkii]
MLGGCERWPAMCLSTAATPLRGARPDVATCSLGEASLAQARLQPSLALGSLRDRTVLLSAGARLGALGAYV